MTRGKTCAQQGSAAASLKASPEMIAAGVEVLYSYGCGELRPALGLAEMASEVYSAMALADSSKPELFLAHGLIEQLRGRDKA